MSRWLYLFHSTVGVVQTRKALQTAGVTFQIKDIPRQLRSGCGLCVLIEGTEEAARSGIIAGHTAALYQQSGEAWHYIASFPQKD
ncbi:TPA: DUF3343 domain-containing protein [Raoultella planticola]|nr:DUF3343 domain-containing protein [Raoultella planticola]HAT1648916.1 DUF3343 domain-containing protein [Raoultella planticola]